MATISSIHSPSKPSIFTNGRFTILTVEIDPTKNFKSKYLKSLLTATSLINKENTLFSQKPSPATQSLPTMDSTSPTNRSKPRLCPKSASRLARIINLTAKPDSTPLQLNPPDSPKESPTTPTLPSPQNPIPIRELLLLSPSPTSKPKLRIVKKPELAEEPADLLIPIRRRCKNRDRGSPMGCNASPKNVRRSRRRIDVEDRSELVIEENVKPKRRKQGSRSRKEKLSLVPSVPLPQKTQDEDQSSLDHIKQLVSDLVMWKDVAKSTLWFGFGSLCILSSCFTRDYRYSIFSAISQLGLMFLAVSFFYNTFTPRNAKDPRLDFKLTEDDIVRVARVFLPAANLVLAKLRELFSGEPSTTLKVAPLLLFGAEFGHLITLWRLYAIGFLVSFTVPKFCSCYSVRISRQAEYLTSWMWEAWGACAHKKVVAASVATVFWNLSSLKTRIFSAFISVVILRYYRQRKEEEAIEGEAEGEKIEQQQQALVVVEEGVPTN